MSKGGTWTKSAGAWAALVIVAAACFKATVTIDPFPAWSGDPIRLEAPVVGLTPTGLLVTDIVMLIAAGVALAAAGGARAGVAALLLAVGAGASLVHAGWGARLDLDGLLLASSWIAAVAGGLGVWAGARDSAVRRIAAASVVSVIVMLAAKGVVQVIVEHPATVTMYQQTRERFLEAQGWSPDSPLARAYERRLMQPEATGWIGLANVYASFGAAAIVAFAGLALAARRGRMGAGATAAACAGLGAGAVALYLAGSKGGWAAAGVGLAALGLAWVVRRRAGTGRWITPALAAAPVLLPLLAVAARGIVGTRIGELSLLFRWFYMQAAARIIAKHPLGVGPDGFKDAYLLAKNPLSPEDVSSPHSILFDWGACLGVAGLAFAALFAWVLWGIAKRLAAPAQEVAPPEDSAGHGIEGRAVFLTLAAATIAGAMLESRLASADAALVRVGGLLAGALVGRGVLKVFAASPDGGALAFAGAGCALAAHMQVEMSGTNPGACAWVFVVLGLAAAGVRNGERGRRAWAVVAGIVPVLAAGAIAASIPRVWRWERSLLNAAASVAPAREFAERAEALGSPGSAGDTPVRLAADLGAALGRPVEPSPISIQRAIGSVITRACVTAGDELLAAHTTLPGHFPTARAGVRLRLQQAVIAERMGENEAAARYALAAREWALMVARDAQHERAPVAAWAAGVNDAASSLVPSSPHRAESIALLERAASLAPYDTTYARDLAYALHRAGEAEAARRWAGRALELDDQHRLDPLTRVSEQDRGRLLDLRAGSPRK